MRSSWINLYGPNPAARSRSRERQESALSGSPVARSRASGLHAYSCHSRASGRITEFHAIRLFHLVRTAVPFGSERVTGIKLRTNSAE
jgi:hypothetical protein